jgi:hypothetical protein
MMLITLFCFQYSVFRSHHLHFHHRISNGTSFACSFNERALIIRRRRTRIVRRRIRIARRRIRVVRRRRVRNFR